MVQDGRVEGHVPTSSHGSSEITTAEQPSAGRRWNPPEEIPHFQKQRRSHSEMAGGVGIPRECDFEGQWDLITRLPQDWGKQRLHSWRAQTNLVCTRTQGKGTLTP